MRAGMVAAAATVGAVGTFAARDGEVLRPFAATGRTLLADPSPAAAALAGLAAYAAVAVLCGLLLAVVAWRTRGPLLLAAAAGVSALALLATTQLAPSLRLGFGLGVFPLRGGPLLFLYALLAAALALGMRLAPRRGGGRAGPVSEVSER